MFNYKRSKSALGLAVALSVFCAQSAFAATLELNLDEAVQRALLTNPDIKIAISQRKGARADLNAARAGRGISISLNHKSGRGGYADNQPINMGGSIIGYSKGIGNAHSNTVEASIPIYTGGELSGRIGQAKAQYRSTVAGEDLAYIDMKRLATDGYFGMLQTGNMETLRQESVNQLQAHLDNVQAQYSVGVVAKVDVLRSEVALANAQQEYIKAANAYAIAEANLNNIIGTPLNTNLELKDTLQYTPYDNDMDYCLQYAKIHRPELEQSEYAVEAAKAGVKVARSGYMPKISASANNNWGGTGSNWPGDDDSNWAVGIGASMNIFDTGVTLSKIHSAEENLLRAEEMLRKTDDAVQLEVRSNYFSLRESEKRISTTQVAVAKAEEDYHIAQVRYQAGVGTNLDVMDAQVALTEAKTNFVQALYDYNTSKIALESSMGVLVMVPLADTPLLQPIEEPQSK